MRFEEFARRVAQRAGVSPDEAVGYARAVFATLRETITEREFHDLEAQLSRDFEAVLTTS
jgi:uncharacterized protein (DUF2267 family)